MSEPDRSSDLIEIPVVPDELLKFLVNIRITLDDHKRNLADIKEVMMESTYEFDDSMERINFVTSTIKIRDNCFRAQVQKLKELGPPREQALDLTPAHTLLALLRRSVKNDGGNKVWSPHPQLSAGVSVSLETYAKKTVSDITLLSDKVEGLLSKLTSSVKVLFLAVNPSMHREGSFKTVALSQHQSVCKLIPRIQRLLDLREKAVREHQEQLKSNIAFRCDPDQTKINLAASLYTPKLIDQNPSFYDIAQSDLHLLNPYSG
ncbi:hypothetical protein DSO57_1026948 [Entomophthora muscae]|uniref:Uncharacterized protein n=1 Tax=Entomophthora muscae TaxID=34485 RepID=A0ACC2SQZ6_9FUNG|nr:hypothetical protein DSO57_1026948 [Entomophthora muscae]